MKDPNRTGVFCPHCLMEFDFTELPWTEDETIDECPSCEKSICLTAIISVKHKIAKTEDDLDFVNAI
ncbi:hypothetical protein JY97_00440 [Alkalispirochaeta odontotermitis]|nr:hypothetical protein JY97_00440 [Alkalispirochaeta odontotermitis]